MREGDLVANRYRIRRHAGAGGMATVYEAFDTIEGVPVALKTWRAAPDTEPRAHSRVWREAQALAEIRHPAIVRYIDHGSTPEHGPFLAMDWIAGETLAERLSARGLRPAEALRLIERLSAGLRAMHAAGVVHRDLKPSNVMLTGGDVDRAIIVDFGVARVARLVDASDGAEHGGHLGTARYMAPEQIRNARTVDGRADVFALGCILFEALTGRPAFEGIDPVTVLARILFEPLPVPTTVRPELPAPLDRLVLAMLARELDRRPRADEVASLIQAAELTGGAALTALGATPVDATRDGKELELTSAAESLRDVPAPRSRQLWGREVATATAGIPERPGSFVGRDEECDHLTALLSTGTRVVTVWGGPGIGKSRLIAEAVRRVAAAPGPRWDAVVFGDLEGARDADDMVRILARNAGVAFDASSTPEVALGNALAKLGRVLLVLDPVDHVATALTAALHVWSHVAPGLQVIAASRSRFRPPGAVTLELGPLGVGGERDRPSPAASLFIDRARQHGGGSRGTTTASLATERVEALVEALDGIPLAIELYAARLSALGLDGLLTRLPGRAGSEATLDGSEAAMTRAIAWSWHLLTPAEQRAFAQCSVFRGGFTMEAAERVVKVDEGASSRELLQSLRDKSLLSSWAVDSDRGARLTMFASVRDFAWQMLKNANELGDALSRHAAYYADAFAPARTTARPDAMAVVERDAENLFAAAEFSLSEKGADRSAGMVALIALEPIMVARGATGSYRGLLDRAIESASPGEELSPLGLLVARLLQIRARLDAPRGKLEHAKEDLARCRREAERVGDAHWLGTIELDLGVVRHFDRDLSAARCCYESALALLHERNDPRAEGRCIGNLGALCHDEGEFSSAARWYRRAIALFERVDDARQRANCVGNLAVLEQELGHLDVARELYERAVRLLEGMRDARVLAITLGNLGVLELEMSQHERALALYERSLELLAGIGDRRSEALCLGRLGAALAVLGRPDEADARIARGERLAPPADAPLVSAVRLQRAFVELARAEAAARAGDDAAAGRWCASLRGRIDAVRKADENGHSLAQRSDDIRSTLRILEAKLARAEQVWRARRREGED